MEKQQTDEGPGPARRRRLRLPVWAGTAAVIIGALVLVMVLVLRLSGGSRDCPAVGYSSVLEVVLTGDTAGVTHLQLRDGDDQAWQPPLLTGSDTSDPALSPARDGDTWTFTLFYPANPIGLRALDEAGNVLAQTEKSWNAVCPNDGDAEIYLIGNPPYVGAKVQTKEQKTDFGHVFERRPYSKNLDYIALWFVKGADYIEGSRAELAFVTTNSVAQGEHVALMFPTIFAKGIEIGFAYTSFKWENNAKRNAGVTVVVVGLRVIRPGEKFIYTGDLQIRAHNINGYLTDGDNVFITKRTKPLSAIPEMSFGSMPNDNGGLVLSDSEREQLISSHPEATRYTKRFLGASEFISGAERFALWLDAGNVTAALNVPEIARRVECVRTHRLASKRESTKKLASVAHRFGEVRYKPTDSIIVPRVSSERRDYMPMGYLGPDTVISDAAFAVYDAEPWLFALLTSRMHMAWTRAVGGQLETRLRYSNTIVYNNFPVPPLSEATKEKLTVAALRVLDVREYHCEQTLAELYDPDKMLLDLREAHAAVDALVDSIYSKRPYETDEQRLSDLFALYERMSAEEAAKAPAKKTRRAAK